MTWENAKIEKAFIGIEDHGIFAWGITFTGISWGQGTGMRGIGAESLPTIKQIVSIFGPWNELQGKVVRIGRDNRQIVAIRDILDDKLEVVL